MSGSKLQKMRDKGTERRSILDDLENNLAHVDGLKQLSESEAPAQAPLLSLELFSL